MSEQCLELKNVCKSFRDFTLNNISFTLPQGYIMGLVGPNGAGKTTTIQLILNMLEKDAGRILAFGKDNVVSEKEIKQDIGIVVISGKNRIHFHNAEEAIGQGCQNGCNGNGKWFPYKTYNCNCQNA